MNELKKTLAGLLVEEAIKTDPQTTQAFIEAELRRPGAMGMVG
jgi:hypothetical protein